MPFFGEMMCSAIRHRMSANSGTRVRALSPQETDRRAKHFEEKLRLLPDSLAVHEEWRKLLVTYGVSGVQVHDARLAAAMRVHGVKRILTFNDRDFARYTDIEAIHPRAAPTK